MMSFTGSTRAGILVTAAQTRSSACVRNSRRVTNIMLDDIELATAVTKGVAGCFGNSGQSCNAPTRMFVPRDKHDQAASYAWRNSKLFSVSTILVRCERPTPTWLSSAN